MPRIEKLYAYVAVDKSPDDEGVAASLNPMTNMWVPLVGADRARMDSLLEKAQLIADVTGKTLYLLEFSVRTQVGEPIKPGGNN